VHPRSTGGVMIELNEPTALGGSVHAESSETPRTTPGSGA
jgi:hypothetical protein